MRKIIQGMLINWLIWIVVLIPLLTFDIAYGANGTVTGGVRDVLTGTALSGASVRLEQSGAIKYGPVSTSPSGVYTINNVVPGSYNVVALATNYQNGSFGITVTSALTTNQNCALTPNGTVTGGVRDVLTGTALSGASVRLEQSSVIKYGPVSTSASGVYTINNVVPGSYNVVALATNYQNGSFSITASSGQTTTQNFALTPTTGTVKGGIRDEITGSPLVGATVRLEQNSSIIDTTNTNSNGEYIFYNVSPGTYNDVGLATGYQNSLISISVSAGVTTNQNLALTPKYGTVTGGVRDDVTGVPLVGASVRLEQNSSIVDTTSTNANGEYAFYNVSPGSYNDVGLATGYQNSLIGISVSAGLTTSQNLALTPKYGTVNGGVRDDVNGAPLVGATVRLEQNSTIIDTTSTNANGEYSFYNVLPGTYNDVGLATGYQNLLISISVSAGLTTNQNLALTPKIGTVTGNVYNSITRLPLAGASVRLEQNGTIVYGPVSTNANGAYTIGNVSPGAYNLVGLATEYQNGLYGVTISAGNATSQNLYLNQTSAQPTWTPLYRAYNNTDKSHFYTINANEKLGPVGKTGYKYEKIEAYISSTKSTGMIPLYRYYYSTDKKFYFYTTISTPRTDGPTEGPNVVGYVFPNPGNNMVPMYHLEKVSATGNDHFYTISESERNNAVSKYQFKDWGVVMYVSRNASNAPLAGKPVANDGGADLFSGNFQPFFNHVDFANSAGKGIPFIFARTYNAMNTAETGPMGYGWSHSYNVGIVEDSSQNMAFVKWGDGAVDSFAVSGSTYTAYCDVAGSTCGNYNKLSKLAGKYTLTTKDYIKYIFSPVTVDTTTYYNLSSIQDRNGNSKVLTYDANGNVYTVKDGSDRIYQFNYIDITTQAGVDSSAFSDGNRYRLSSIVEQEPTLARSIQFAYDSNGNLWKSWDAENNQTTYEYWSGTSFLSKVTLPKGNSWTANYTGEKVTSVVSENQTTSYSYDDPTKGTIVNKVGNTGGTPSGAVTSNCIHTGSNLKSCTNASNKSSEILAWHDNSNPTQVKDRNSNIWNYTYNAVGNVLTATSPAPLNEITRYEYDLATGLNLTKSTDPAGNVTDYEYINNNLYRTKNYDVVNGVTKTLITQIDYYSFTDHLEWNGLVKSVIDPRNNVTTYLYDTRGYLAKIIDPYLKETTFTYDAGGRLLDRTDADGVKAYFTYDKLNRIKTVKNALNQTTSYFYDLNGNLDYTVDPRNIRKQNTYRPDTDLLDKVDAINNSTGSTTMLVQYGYDAQNRVNDIKNGRQKSWKYNFNDDDSVNKITTPIASIFDQFTLYDGNGNLKTLIDRSSRTIQFDYDVAGRMKTQTVGTSGSYSFNYFPNSLMQSVSSPQGRSNAFTYTARNLVKTYTDPFGNVTNYTYDEAGNLKTISYPGSKVVTYGYDNANRLTSVTDINNKTTYYDYKPSGRIWKIRYPNGALIEYFYDAYGRMWKMENRKADNSVIAGYTVDTFDELGAPKQITTTGGLLPTAVSSDSGTLSYDDNNRISGSSTGATFTSNNFGELLTKTQGGTTTTFTWNANDLPGRLTGVAVGGKSSSFSYDALGNRIEAIRDGVATRYVLDVSGALSNVLYETNEIGTIKAYNIHGLGLVSRILADGTERYYHYDRIGNTVALTDTGGSVTDQYAYEADPFAFGVTKSELGATNNPFTFVGQYGVMDEGNNIYFMRARYYDADLGRFVSEDPIGLDGGDLNVYAYVEGNPVVNVDFDGNESWSSLAMPAVSAALDYKNPAAWIGLGYGLSKKIIESQADRLGNAVYNYFGDSIIYASDDLEILEKRASKVQKTADLAFEIVSTVNSVDGLKKSAKKLEDLANSKVTTASELKKHNKLLLKEGAKFSYKTSKTLGLQPGKIINKTKKLLKEFKK